eukprot:TRINITY_DN11680_c0_g1_i1.p1 TRINITY_DN11680_c0_g1~~TRINITY_DN11680_c0_g1_i1.p1  ORF type:complete len:221 (+),score=19.56 TRINITY_DN11680_c0_g1_i1:173-835(+)
MAAFGRSAARPPLCPRSARDTSFLPGPAQLAPHLAAETWKRSCGREEQFAMTGLASARGGSCRPQTRGVNPITWEDEEDDLVSLPSTRRTSSQGSCFDGPSFALRQQLHRGGPASSRLSSAMSSAVSCSSAYYSERSAGSSRSCQSHSRRSARSYSASISRRRGGACRSSASGSVSSATSTALEAEREQRRAVEDECVELRRQLAEARRVTGHKLHSLSR